MITHVGGHFAQLIQSGVRVKDKLCGMCGGTTCKWKLVTKKHSTKAHSEECTALYNYNYKAAKKGSKSSPCTNVPMKCKSCDNTYVFRYALRSHCYDVHPGQQLPDQVSDEELNGVLEKCVLLVRPRR